MSRRLRSRLTWGAREAAPAGFRAAFAGAVAPERAGFDQPAAPRELAIQLLHVGAEIEHALMVQYLYAAYSLDEAQETPAHRALVKRWREVVSEIAREEMGHLASVQNLLTLVGGPLCFDREDFPIIDPNLWPFSFELEPLTKTSLAKYVLAEAPDDDVLAQLGIKDEVDAIKQRLTVDRVVVNRVGAVYARLHEVFTLAPMIEGPPVRGAPKDHAFVPTADIQPDSLPYQISASAWGLGYEEILIRTATDREKAIAAIEAVSIQGEGPLGPGADLEPSYRASHFGRFLEIYREFPEPDAWRPSGDVACNPTTNQTAPDERRVEGEALLWAHLANLRYRMLLLYLEHSFLIEAPTTHPTRSPRGALVTMAFGEMYNLRSLAEILMRMPLKPSSTVNAGPPFEMPYSRSLPIRAPNRWRAHRDLLLASRKLVDDLFHVAPTDRRRFLASLQDADATALGQVEALIGA